MRFSFKYLLLFLLVLSAEIGIALYAQGYWMRAVLGDFLVVILIYSFLKIFIKGKQAQVAIGVFVFAVMVEVSQYMHLAERIGVADQKWAQLTMGSNFDWLDLLAYFIGTWTILFLEFQVIKYDRATN